MVIPSSTRPLVTVMTNDTKFAQALFEFCEKHPHQVEDTKIVIGAKIADKHEVGAQIQKAVNNAINIDHDYAKGYQIALIAAMASHVEHPGVLEAWAEHNIMMVVEDITTMKGLCHDHCKKYWGKPKVAFGIRLAHMSEKLKIIFENLELWPQESIQIRAVEPVAKPVAKPNGVLI